MCLKYANIFFGRVAAVTELLNSTHPNNNVNYKLSVLFVRVLNIEHHQNVHTLNKRTEWMEWMDEFMPTNMNMIYERMTHKNLIRNFTICRCTSVWKRSNRKERVFINGVAKRLDEIDFKIHHFDMCTKFSYAAELSEKFASYSTNLITLKYFDARIVILWKCILCCVVLRWLLGERLSFFDSTCLSYIISLVLYKRWERDRVF